MSKNTNLRKITNYLTADNNILSSNVSQTITGSLTVTGNLTAQQFIVSSSVTYLTESFASGSHKFGDSSDDIHTFTGSLVVSGSANPFTVGTNLLFVSSSGNVGINNVSPTVALDVTGAGKFSDTITAAKITTSTTLNGDPQLGFFTNASTGTSAEAVIYIKNGATTNDATFVETTGTNFTNIGGFIQNGGVIGTGTSLAGGLSLMVRANADMRFYTNGHTNERMRITSGGNVLIGTSTLGTATGTSDLLTIGKSGSSSTGINFTDGTSTRWGFIYINNAKTVYGSFTDTAFETGASATERMRITSGGALCIGMTTSPYGRVSIKSNSATIYAGFGVYAASNENFTLLNHDGNVGYIGCDSTATGFATPLSFWINSAIRMTMSTNGSIGAPSGTNIYNASDARLKKNISTTTYGLDTISALNPVKFNWVDGFEPSENGKDMLGFIAQEVQTVIPEAIESFGGNSITIGDTIIDNPLRVNEKFIIPVLVKAIQELSDKNTALEEILQRNNIV